MTRIPLQFKDNKDSFAFYAFCILQFFDNNDSFACCSFFDNNESFAFGRYDKRILLEELCPGKSPSPPSILNQLPDFLFQYLVVK